MINYIKVEKDQDDINVTVQFSGRDEWNHVKGLIAMGYVDSSEIAQQYTKLNPSRLRELYDSMLNLLQELETEPI